MVRRSAVAIGHNDWDRAIADYDAEVEWVEMPSLGPDAATYVGIDELRAAVESWKQMWDEYETTLEQVIDAGENGVVVLGREHGRGSTSGVVVEREIGQLVTVRDAKIVGVRLYGSWDEALEAAGVSRS